MARNKKFGFSWALALARPDTSINAAIIIRKVRFG